MNKNQGKLENLEINEVSAVDAPANPFAMMVLWKKRDKTIGDNDMNIEELTKRLEETETAMETLIKALGEAGVTVEKKDGEYSIAKAVDINETLIKALGEAGVTVEEKDGEFTVTKAKDEEPEYVEIDGERVLKSAVPAPILRQLETQSTEIAALKKKGEDEALAGRAEKMFPNLGGTPVEKSCLVKMLDDLGEKERATMEKSLKAADAAVAKMFDEIGGNTAEDSDAQKELDGLVQKHMEDKNVTKAVAFSEVTKSGRGRQLLVETRSEAN